MIQQPSEANLHRCRPLMCTQIFPIAFIFDVNLKTSIRRQINYKKCFICVKMIVSSASLFILVTLSLVWLSRKFYQVFVVPWKNCPPGKVIFCIFKVVREIIR